MRASTTVSLLCIAGCAPAALAAQEAPGPAVVHKQSDISYVSGGATQQEARELQRIANKFPMQLRFVIGEQPSAGKGVRVRIKNLRGDIVVDTVSEGPVFYFNPPSGRWTVEAEYKGETVSKTVDLIGRRYIGLQFEFKGEGLGAKD